VLTNQQDVYIYTYIYMVCVCVAHRRSPSNLGPTWVNFMHAVNTITHVFPEDIIRMIRFPIDKTDNRSVDRVRHS